MRTSRRRSVGPSSDAKKTDVTALSAPVPPPATVYAPHGLPTLHPQAITSSTLTPTAVASQPPVAAPASHWYSRTPKTSVKTVQASPALLTGNDQPVASASAPQPISSAARTPESSPFVVASLKDAGPGPRRLSDVSSDQSSAGLHDSVASPAAPSRVLPKAQSEDNLLQVISLQSNPARAGAYSGLSGMRQLRETKDLIALNTISTATPQSIPDDSDKPENYLGDITVGAKHSH